ncbi:MAG: DUF2225 domain-containing protein [bacterium]
MQCPICGGEFGTLNVREDAYEVIEREPDFHAIYRGVNPLWYAVWVCPYCLYGRRREDFLTANFARGDQIRDKYAILHSIAGERDFTKERDIDLALRSILVALECGKILSLPSAELGGLALRVAWLYREMEMREEREYLKLALEYYTKAYEAENTDLGVMGEDGLIYIIGEIRSLLCDFKGAIDFFNKLVVHPKTKPRLEILRLASQEWLLAKELLEGKSLHRNR